MRNNESFLIHGWMRNEMGLSGVELSVFALIHDITIDGNAVTQKQIVESIGITERTAINLLNEFISNGYVKKTQELIKGKRINTYTSCVDLSYEKFSYNLVPPASMKNFHTREKEAKREEYIEDYPISNTLIKENEVKDIDYTSDSNDIVKGDKDNIKAIKSKKISNNSTKDIQKEKINRFIPPTIEQVREYCESRNNGIDPEHFVDFYSSKGWMIGKNKMKDWKAAVRTWENKNKEKKRQEQKEYEATHITDLDDIF